MGEAETLRILGHRGGAAGHYPENSIPAFQFGLQEGADAVELDVRLSRDNRVMVVHDPIIDRISQGSGAVAELGAAELRRHALLDGGGTPHPDTRIPVLEEVFEVLEGKLINIDLKTADTRLARAVVDIVRRYDAVERTTVASFIPEAMQFFRSLAPEIATSTDPVEVRELLKSRLLREQVATAASRVQIPPRYRMLPIATRGFVRFVHRQNLAVDVWTINSPRVALHLQDIGVDGIVTDNVAAICNALNSGRNT